MKSGRKKMFRMITVLALTMALLFSQLQGWGLATVQARGTTDDLPCLGTKDIKNPTAGSWNYVYFGKLRNSYTTPVRYRVLTKSTTSFSEGSGKETMLLDCDGDLGYYNGTQREFDVESSPYANPPDTELTNQWEKASIRSYLNETFYEEAFSDGEKAVIVPSTKTKNDPNDGWVGGFDFVPLNNDKVFVLDATEASNGKYGYYGNSDRIKYPLINPIEDPRFWWLRSVKSWDDEYVAGVNNYGNIVELVANTANVLTYPAFNIDVSSILFSWRIPDTNEFTLTVNDADMVLTAGTVSSATVDGKNMVTIPYELTGDHKGRATQISVLMTDLDYTNPNAQVKYYGKLETAAKPAEVGSGTFEWPADYDNWKTYIIAEQVTGEHETDYASLPVEIATDHFHNFTYSLSEDKKTITATCNSSGCSLALNKTDLTISAPLHEVYFDHKSPEAVIQDDDGIRGNSPIVYYKADSDSNKTGDPLGSAPETPGTYWAEITVGTGTNSATAHVVYSIDKEDNYMSYVDGAEVIVGGNTVDLSKNINGPTGKVIYEIDQDDTDGQCKVDKDSGVFTSGQKTGTCTVRVTDPGDENTKSVTVSITVTVKAKSSYSMQVKQKDAVYEDQLEDPEYPEWWTGWVGEAEIIYTGTVWDGTKYEPSATKPDQVGKYKVTVKRELQRYIASGSDDFEILAKKVTKPVIEINPASFTYDGSEKKPEVTVKDGDKVIPPAEYNLKYSDNINPGQAKVTVIDKDGGNYMVNGSASFTITPGDYELKEKKSSSQSGVRPQMAKAAVKGKTKVLICWGRVRKADRYIVLISKCNNGKKLYKVKKIKTIKGNAITSYLIKDLIEGQYYKFKVIAQQKVKGKYKTIYASKLGHFVGGNKSRKYTNPKALILNKNQITLKKGRSFRIQAKIIPEVSGKKILPHGDLVRYTSSNKKIARVSKKGRVTAVKAGSCKIYVQTVNGIWKPLKVVVK